MHKYIDLLVANLEISKSIVYTYSYVAVSTSNMSDVHLQLAMVFATIIIIIIAAIPCHIYIYVYTYLHAGETTRLSRLQYRRFERVECPREVTGITKPEQCVVGMDLANGQSRGLLHFLPSETFSSAEPAHIHVHRHIVYIFLVPRSTLQAFSGDSEEKKEEGAASVPSWHVHLLCFLGAKHTVWTSDITVFH